MKAKKAFLITAPIIAIIIVIIAIVAVVIAVKSPKDVGNGGYDKKLIECNANIGGGDILLNRKIVSHSCDVKGDCGLLSINPSQLGLITQSGNIRMEIGGQSIKKDWRQWVFTETKITLTACTTYREGDLKLYTESDNLIDTKHFEAR